MSGESRGVVVSFDPDRGFGFIRAPGLGEDVFVHASEVVGGGGLRAGQRVRFLVEGTDRGPRAVRVLPGSIGLPPALASATIVIGTVSVSMVLLRLAGLPLALAWTIPISLATLAVWAWDKHRAVRDARRVPEATLLGLAAIGGTIGALFGVIALNHKRSKPRFLMALGAIAVVQVIAILILSFRD
jgi:uncharacterized membrane protein YsdA (DUF1294 family)/cold shock CspA family protein